MPRENRLFTGCVVALIATSFGFITRALLLTTIGIEFGLTESQKGSLQGVGLFPFALSIIFFSLILDKIGYGRAMAIAWSGHVVSAILTITAHNFTTLYVGTLLFALSNGVVEAVVNPVTATLFSRNKTQRLNILHSGWAGGLVLGGLIAIALGSFGWRFKIGLFFIPTLIYGWIMLGQKFPVQERVVAGVPYSEMLKEFGWASCFIVCFFICYAINEVFIVFNGHFLWAEHEFLSAAIFSMIPTVLFAIKFKSFGRPMFVFLFFVMILSATTELGTDSWITDLLTPAMQQLGMAAGWVLVYTSAIMLALRLSAGLFLRRFSPIGLLAICSVMTALGLFWIAHAKAAGIIFIAATLYGVGKTFFWPTTLGIVSEQFPRGGALTLNAVSGVGMISVGVLGAAFLGTLQDVSLDRNLQKVVPALHEKITNPSQTKFAMTFRPLNEAQIEALPQPEKSKVEKVVAQTKQTTIAKFSILPAILLVCYAALLLVFKSRGGYKQVSITAK